MKPSQLITSILALAIAAIANPIAEPEAEAIAQTSTAVLALSPIDAGPAAVLAKRKDVSCGQQGSKEKPAWC